MNCTQCNRELKEGVSFCPECGTKQEPAQESVQEQVDEQVREQVDEQIDEQVSEQVQEPDAQHIAQAVAQPTYASVAPAVNHGQPNSAAKKPSTLAIVAAASLLLAVVMAIVLVVTLGGTHNNRALFGTWEETTASAWRERTTFNRNGTGLIFEVNVDTGMTSNETSFRWSTSRDFDDLVRIVIYNPFDPTQYDAVWIEFNVTVNAIGETILNMRMAGDWHWEHARRVN